MGAGENWVNAGHSPAIIWMPMTDAATAHINEGTGGNFTLNGTIATSNRGANQDNCKASYFDGSADYLSKNIAVSGATALTCSFSYNCFNSVASQIFELSGTTDYSTISIYAENNGIKVWVWSNTGQFAYWTLAIGAIHKTAYVQISLTLDGTNIYYKKSVNGVISTGSQAFAFPSLYTSNSAAIGRRAPTALRWFNGNIGELYFDTTYIDIETDNPFWDSVENKPVPVRKVIANTGVTPLIAMPLDASNAGKNYGTGGDFTVNSGPYVGARGASEFWARSISGDGTTGYLKRTSLTGLADSKTFTFMCGSYMDGSNTDTLLSIQFAGLTPNNFRILSSANTTPNLDIIGSNTAGTIILNTSYSSAFPAITKWATILISCDLSTSSVTLCVNGVLKTTTPITITNDFFKFTNANAIYIGAEENSGAVRQWWQGDLSCMYFTTDYIDFSQEVNRLKFVDGLGYPLDLKKQIDAGVIPNPLIYLPFDDTTNLGKNLGTGGDFTVNGTVTAGADVLG